MYPLFIPPAELASTVPWDWSKSQADTYHKWLVSILEERTTHLLKYGGINSRGHNEILEKIEIFASKKLTTPQFSLDEKLTSQGYALAADLGLLIAKLLLEASNAINWQVVRRPKSDISYNQPVLMGFIGFKGIYLNPIGGQIADASALVTHQVQHLSVSKTYHYWLDLAQDKTR